MLLEGGAVAGKYRVHGYSALYLMDKKGKVIYTQIGYGKETEAELEELIKKNL